MASDSLTETAERLGGLHDEERCSRWKAAWGSRPEQPCYCPRADNVEAILYALRSERRAGREAMREEAAKAAESAYPCSCDESYTLRKMTAPDCFRCNPLDEAAAMIRALPLDPA